MRNTFLSAWLVAASFVALPLLALPQSARQMRTLIVNGQSGEAPVVEAGGHTYVDLEALTRIANGSLVFQDDQIVLTIPASSAPPPADSAFSKAFMRAAIEELSVIREWRNSLKNAIERSYPINDDWLSLYRDQAADALRRASVEANTDADRSALQLFTNEFNNMNDLADKYLENSNAAEYTPSDALKDDPMHQRIITCARSLVAMVSNGRFSDDGSCP
ncbi:MAG TPA: hypothetical protein VG051_05795 [Candidatus Acidoferrum sp.]|jgi:hypothetical protein|nr:hypothetical protein [Candidatus Acidoferrum sp.]